MHPSDSTNSAGIEAPHRARSETVFDPTLFLIGILGVALRVALALYNTQANDDHLEVSKFIIHGLENGSFPDQFASCWECYHPKLYHVLCALFSVLFLPINAPHNHHILIAQGISVLSGAVSLLVIGRIIQKNCKVAPLKPVLFALFVFNPEMVSINIQATNDSLAIALGILSFYWIDRFLTSSSWRSLALASLSTYLGLLTKGNMLVFLPVMVCAALALIARSNALNSKRLALGLLCSSSLIVWASVASPSFMSPYGSYYQRLVYTGSLAAVNFSKAPMPNFFEETSYRRPGITSIASGYLTFRLLDLIKTPLISQDPNSYPRHRTSLWSQIYGRYHSIYFAQWPWTSHSRILNIAASAGFVLGLLPLLYLVVGVFQSARGWIAGLVKRTQPSDFYQATLNLSTFFGFLSMLCIFCLEHRGFESMKAIYILPSLGAMTTLQLVGVERICAHRSNTSRRLPVIIFLTRLVGWSLVGCFLLGELHLLFKLSE